MPTPPPPPESDRTAADPGDDPDRLSFLRDINAHETTVLIAMITLKKTRSHGYVAFLHRNSIYDLLYAAVNYYYDAPVSPFTTAGYRLGRGGGGVVVPRNGRGPSAVALPSRNVFYYTCNVIPVNLRISPLRHRTA